jgi:tRNA nucleotidyltransferase (CCA-adding enzyme)
MALDHYVLDVRKRRPHLGGDALRQLGLPPGPRYRSLLAQLMHAVLNGELPDADAEWRFLSHLVEAEGDS